MATWITHLRIAENLLTCLPGLEAGPFAIGNIAPDSGIPDANWEKFTPDPKITHFTGRPISSQCADLDFYRRYLLPLKAQPGDAAVFSFRLGYFFHLVTDNLWQVTAYRPAKAKYSTLLAADPRFIEEVKQDWYGQDFIYVRSHSECLFWKVFLDVRPDTAGLDFLPPDALRQRVEYIQAFYQRRDEEIQAMVARPMVYFSAAEMDCFVETTSIKLKAVFDHLWVKEIEIDNPYSMLDWALSI
jgi:hypothetical protein